MSEIKPVYQKSKNDIEWLDIENNYEEDDQHNYRTLYPAAAYEELQKENAALRKQVDELQKNSLSNYKKILCQLR